MQKSDKILPNVYTLLNFIWQSTLMFWNKKKNTDKHKKSKSSKAGSVEGKLNNKNSNGQGLAGDALRAQALANARAARENLGDDTIQKIAEIMGKKENSAMEQAKRRIQSTDKNRVADGILDMLDER